MKNLPSQPLEINIPGLSPQESRVARMIAHGDRRQGIARELNISVKTFDSHRLHILEKLEVDNDVLLTRKAIKEGWVWL